MKPEQKKFFYGFTKNTLIKMRRYSDILCKFANRVVTDGICRCKTTPVALAVWFNSTVKHNFCKQKKLHLNRKKESEKRTKL